MDVYTCSTKKAGNFEIRHKQCPTFFATLKFVKWLNQKLISISKREDLIKKRMEIYKIGVVLHQTVGF
ncbi:MAG: hypothetical protein ACJARP_001854 [Vicingaceae bacterium]